MQAPSELCVSEEERRFAAKLRTFLDDYGLQAQPCLVLQARLVNAEIEVDVADPSVRVALAQGGVDSSSSTWSGLQRSSAALLGSVDGISCVSSDAPPTWASELHTDGHLIAGVWDFELPGQAGPTFVTWEYGEFFSDFGRLAGNVASKFQEGSGDWMVTAILLRSDRLQYGSRANRHSNRLRSPLRRRDLAFRIRRCTGPDGLRRVAQLMGKDFARAYGEPWLRGTD